MSYKVNREIRITNSLQGHITPEEKKISTKGGMKVKQTTYIFPSYRTPNLRDSKRKNDRESLDHYKLLY